MSRASGPECVVGPAADVQGDRSCDVGLAAQVQRLTRDLLVDPLEVAGRHRAPRAQGGEVGLHEDRRRLDGRRERLEVRAGLDDLAVVHEQVAAHQVLGRQDEGVMLALQVVAGKRQLGVRDREVQSLHGHPGHDDPGPRDERIRGPPARPGDQDGLARVDIGRGQVPPPTR